MNKLLELLGFRRHEYLGGDFSVNLRFIGREGVKITYRRRGDAAELSGERMQGTQQGIDVVIPAEMDKLRVSQAVTDLETALRALSYGYIIRRRVEIEVVPESERANAIQELRKMGYEIEVSEDRKQIRQRRIGNARLTKQERLKMRYE